MIYPSNEEMILSHLYPPNICIMLLSLTNDVKGTCFGGSWGPQDHLWVFWFTKRTRWTQLNHDHSLLQQNYTKEHQ